MTTLEDIAGLLHAALERAARSAEQEANAYLDSLRAAHRSERGRGAQARKPGSVAVGEPLARLETVPRLERLADHAPLALAAPLVTPQGLLDEPGAITDQQRARLMEIFNAAFTREMQRILAGGEVT